MTDDSDKIKEKPGEKRSTLRPEFAKNTGPRIDRSFKFRVRSIEQEHYDDVLRMHTRKIGANDITLSKYIEAKKATFQGARKYVWTQKPFYIATFIGFFTSSLSFLYVIKPFFFPPSLPRPDYLIKRDPGNFIFFKFFKISCLFVYLHNMLTFSCSFFRRRSV